MIFLAVFVTLVVVLVYIFLVRPVLVNSVALSPAFKAEASYFTQLRTKMVGWKTKLASRVVMLSGALVGLYDTAAPIVAGQDWTPITQKLPSWSIPVGLVVIGFLFSYLRKVTENPPQVITAPDAAGDPHVVAVIPVAPVK